MDQRLWNVDPARRGEISDPARLVRRAGVFFVLSPEMFRQNFAPLIRNDPELTAAFLAWQMEQANRLRPGPR